MSDKINDLRKALTAGGWDLLSAESRGTHEVYRHRDTWKRITLHTAPASPHYESSQDAAAAALGIGESPDNAPE